ncbi:MAG: NAD(P)H-binding protein [Polyangiaceae bacterium]|nr:NAD(P)H-binding protein [Polyangiaceae bacterium]
MKSDVVLFGATGFTGRLVAEYLAAHAPSGFRWAMAGRNREKLEEIRRALGPAAAEVPLIVADAQDAAALQKIAEETKVVCTTVGPFALHGRRLARACAKAGTHYCDITGEVNFVRASIDENHVVAKESGARIVHCCGFDSIPSDLGTLMLAETFAERFQQKLGRVKFFAGETSGGFSGGTIASMLQLLDAAKQDRALRKLLRDPYSLSPDRKSDLDLDGPDSVRVRWEPSLQRVAGPFVMAAVNTRIVRRSNALSGFAYGRKFRYSEEMTFGRGPRAWVTAAAVVAGLGAFLKAATFAPTRMLLDRYLPGPGDGPDAEARKRGFFKIRIVAESEDGREKLLGRVEGTSDPGYGETAKMLSETAMALAAEDRSAGGVLTPATALGMKLVTRLRNAGMVFTVEPLPGSTSSSAGLGKSPAAPQPSSLDG